MRTHALSTFRSTRSGRPHCAADASFIFIKSWSAWSSSSAHISSFPADIAMGAGVRVETAAKGAGRMSGRA